MRTQNTDKPVKCSVSLAANRGRVCRITKPIARSFLGNKRCAGLGIEDYRDYAGWYYRNDGSDLHAERVFRTAWQNYTSPIAEGVQGPFETEAEALWDIIDGLTA